MNSSVEVLIDMRDRLGEGPIHWVAQDALAWVDILDGEIHVASWRGEHLETYRMPEEVGCIFELPSGELLAGCRSGIREVASGRLVVRLPPSGTGVRINDGKVDPYGRLVFGTMGFPEPSLGIGRLWRYDGRRITTLLTDLTIPNGLDWMDGGRTMLFVDTPTRAIRRYAYGPADSPLDRGEVWADLQHVEGVPDGLSVDRDSIWVASWGGSSVLRVVDGRVVDRVPTGAKFTTSVIMSPDGRSLIVTTAMPDSGPRDPNDFGGGVLLCSLD